MVGFFFLGKRNFFLRSVVDECLVPIKMMEAISLLIFFHPKLAGNPKPQKYNENTII